MYDNLATLSSLQGTRMIMDVPQTDKDSADDISSRDTVISEDSKIPTIYRSLTDAIEPLENASPGERLYLTCELYAEDLHQLQQYEFETSITILPYGATVITKGDSKSVITKYGLTLESEAHGHSHPPGSLTEASEGDVESLISRAVLSPHFLTGDDGICIYDVPARLRFGNLGRVIMDGSDERNQWLSKLYQQYLVERDVQFGAMPPEAGTRRLDWLRDVFRFLDTVIPYKQPDEYPEGGLGALKRFNNALFGEGVRPLSRINYMTRFQNLCGALRIDPDNFVDKAKEIFGDPPTPKYKFYDELTLKQKLEVMNEFLGWIGCEKPDIVRGWSVTEYVIPWGNRDAMNAFLYAMYHPDQHV